MSSGAVWPRICFGENIETIAVLLADGLMCVVVKTCSCQADSSKLSAQSPVPRL